ncbi:PEP-CTERM sorting domain-containing protein [Alteromonadaceae bacterium BrNp21-10]|nr:PEP-CTERM sorting domain-containing protein [Alteromonadaceae bacterium BrNp21-10]
MLRNSLIVIVSLLAAQAYAGTETQNWTFNGSNISGNGNGNSINLASGDVTLTITGWSNTGRYNTLETGTLGYDNGYGLTLKNRDEGTWSPDHSIDSFYNSNVDAILLEFNKAVNLDHLGIGWATDGSGGGSGAVDISIAAYTGSNADYTNFYNTNTNTWGELLSNGWKGVNTVNNNSDDDFLDMEDYTYHAIDTGTVTSKYWLVSAYNPLFGDYSSYAGSENDGFKLTGLSSEYTKKEEQEKPPGIPEPSTIAMFAFGLFSLVRMRKEKHISL